MKNIKNKAFSLLELAIVMVIIGLLAVGITGGHRLIQKANVSRARMFTQSSPVPGIDGLQVWAETSLEDSIEHFSFTYMADEWMDLSTNGHNFTRGWETDAPMVTKNTDGIDLLQFRGYEAIASGNSSSGTGYDVTVGTVFIVADVDNNIGSYVLDIVPAWNTTSAGTGSATHKIAQDGNGNEWDTYRTNGAAGAASDIFTRGFGIYGFIADTTDTGIVRFMGDCTASKEASGTVAELIIYDRQLDSSEIEDIEEYLSKKYNIAI